MDVLMHLVERHNQLVTADELLEACWAGTFYGDNPVHKAIAQLRKVLGDKASESRYIETIRKRGYRLIAPLTYPDGAAPGRVEQTWSKGSPYLGLESFDGEHADVFFGRDVAIAAVLDRVRKNLAGQSPFLLLLGPSGSGKSSLLQAGVLPQLSGEHGAQGVRSLAHSIIDMRSQRAAVPLEALAAGLSGLKIDDREVFLTSEQNELLDQLSGDKLTDALVPLTRAINRYQQIHQDDETTVVITIVLDQFEQICANQEITSVDRDRFMQALQTLADTGRAVILAAARNDFYHEIMRLPGLFTLKGDNGQFDVLPPSSGEITEMIRKPAAAAGLSFEQDSDSLVKLDDQIRDDAINHSDILPLLQYTLNELYHRRDSSNELTFAAYGELGGLQGALSRKVEGVVEELDSAAQNSLGYLLGKLITQADDFTIAARTTDWQQISDDNERRLAQALVDARLLTSELVDGKQVLSVTHESLFEHWPRAKTWIDSHRDLLRSYADLNTAAIRWQNENFARDYLLGDGKPLLEAKQLNKTDQIQLEPLDQRFIRESLKRAKGRSRLRSSALVAVISLAILTSVASVVAITAQQTAVERQAQAEGLVGYMLGDLSDRLQPLGRLNILDSVSDAAMAYLESIPDEDTAPDTVLLRVKALIQIGRIRLNQSNTAGAKEAFLEATRLVDQLAQVRPRHEETLLEAGNAQFWVGETFRTEHNFEEARKYWTAYQQYAEQWATFAPGNPTAIIEQSYAWTNLGALAGDADDWATASDYFERSVRLKQDVLERQPDNITLRLELAESLSWLASSLERQGQLKQAGDYFLQGYTVLKALQQQNVEDNTTVAHRIARIQRHRAILSRVTGQLELAKSISEEAVGIGAKLIDIDSTNSEWRRVYSEVLVERGRVALVMGNTLSAYQYVSDGLRTLKEVTDVDSNNAVFHSILNSQMYVMTRIDQHNGKEKEAVDLLNIILEQIDADSKNKATLTLQANILISRGEILCRSGDLKGLTDWQVAEQLLQPLVINSNDYKALEPWVKTQAYQNKEYQSAMERLSATGYHNRSLLEQLTREYPICQIHHSNLKITSM